MDNVGGFWYLTKIVIDMESLVKDVRHLSKVTKLAHHVVEVRNLWVMYIRVFQITKLSQIILVFWYVLGHMISKTSPKNWTISTKIEWPQPIFDSEGYKKNLKNYFVPQLLTGVSYRPKVNLRATSLMLFRDNPLGHVYRTQPNSQISQKSASFIIIMFRSPC